MTISRRRSQRAEWEDEDVLANRDICRQTGTHAADGCAAAIPGLRWNARSRRRSFLGWCSRAVAPRRRRRISAPDGSTPGPTEVLKFAGLMLTADVAAAHAFVGDLRQRGTPVESLYLDLLAPAARHLGDLWCADACDFATVTMGLGRLQQLLHELSPAFGGELEHREHGRRALLVPVPGEQHTFGLLMVVEFFRRAGWDVWSGSQGTSFDLVRLVRGEWFSVVGLSVGSETRIDALSAGIRAIRRASLNRNIGILVGGPIFVAHPELVARVGADATAIDGGQAALQAENLLTLFPGRH